MDVSQTVTRAASFSPAADLRARLRKLSDSTLEGCRCRGGDLAPTTCAGYLDLALDAAAEANWYAVGRLLAQAECFDLTDERRAVLALEQGEWKEYCDARNAAECERDRDPRWERGL